MVILESKKCSCPKIHDWAKFSGGYHHVIYTGIMFELNIVSLTECVLPSWQHGSIFPCGTA